MSSGPTIKVIRPGKVKRKPMPGTDPRNRSRSDMFDVCANCGSDLVEIPVTVVWSHEEQRYEYHDYDDSREPWCPECGDVVSIMTYEDWKEEEREREREQ